MRRSRRVLALLAFILVLAAACSSAPAGQSFSSIGNNLTDSAAKGAPAAIPAPDARTTLENGIPTLVTNPSRNLILTANIAMKSQDPWATADKARAIANGLGGDILAMSQTGQGENRSALITVRVPSDRFDEALRQLKLLDGEVVTSNVDAKDVTDQFTDLQARLVAKQAEEQRYLQLFPQAKTVDETLKIDAALGNVRTQIEQLQGQLNLIKNRTDFSTITMSIAPIVTVPAATAGTWDPAVTFAKAIAALSVFFKFAADLAIWLLVFGWIPLIGLALVLAATRMRRPGITAPTS
ncbi:MAG TPA: DUF4349 domain-containing protein [Candidatus Limnocylindria bacterium]|nr:DUF4349 domain-containing protein [Candidatus Limnocylindria bacterium]